MANFNYTIDCRTPADAEEICRFIKGIDVYQYGFEVSLLDPESVSGVGKQAILDEVLDYADSSKAEVFIAMYPEGYGNQEEAAEAGELDKIANY